MRTLADGRYQLERRLGSGGMASVHLARDAKLGREVAVKVLAENFAGDGEARKRFEREARLAAKLDHANIVQVFDVGEEEGTPFIVMEHVDGGTLADVVASRRRPRASRSVDLFRQACAGIEHAHSQGLVHRDVKPQNLLIRRDDNRLKVADFGIARALEETGVTRPGLVLGTEGYMAPEQLEGDQPTPASDVYALGVVGRELFGGRPPPELEPVLRRCRERDPRERYADAGELCAALESPRSEPREATTRKLGDAPTGGRIAPTERMTRERAAARRRPGGLRLHFNSRMASVLALGVGGLLALVLIASSLDGGSADSGAGEAGDVRPAPRFEDPARQGRAFADWLRDRSQ